jgi:hypothetical protein
MDGSKIKLYDISMIQHLVESDYSLLKNTTVKLPNLIQTESITQLNEF